MLGARADRRSEQGAVALVGDRGNEAFELVKCSSSRVRLKRASLPFRPRTRCWRNMCGTPAPGPGRLVESRNAIEHTGWTLARVKYAHTGTGVTAAEPEISGQPVTEFVKFVLDRLCCYVWAGNGQPSLREYACHEANYSFRGIMRGARVMEAETLGRADQQ